MNKMEVRVPYLIDKKRAEEIVNDFMPGKNIHVEEVSNSIPRFGGKLNMHRTIVIGTILYTEGGVANDKDNTNSSLS